MAHAEHSVTINRPGADVFAFLADGERCAEWRDGVVQIKKVSGEGVGAQYKQSVKGPGGRSVAADYKITEYKPNSVIAFETTSGPVRPHGRYELSERGASTAVKFTLDAELRGLKKVFMGGMVGKTMAVEVRALDKAKRVLEG